MHGKALRRRGLEAPTTRPPGDGCRILADGVLVPGALGDISGSGGPGDSRDGGNGGLYDARVGVTVDGASSGGGSGSGNNRKATANRLARQRKAAKLRERQSV